MRFSTKTPRLSGLALLLWCAPAVIELLVIAAASTGYDEVADASPFGRSGTILVTAATTGIVCVGAIAARYGASGALHVILGAAAFVAAAMVALLGWFF